MSIGAWKTLIKNLWTFIFRAKIKNEKVVLVYTMGKVGSKSIVNSLRHKDIPVLDIHFLLGESIFDDETTYKKNQ